MAVLVLSAWPRQLSFGRALPRAQLAATHVLAQIAVLPGVSIFTGRTDDPNATLSTCFRISGYTAERERVVLFDSMARCRDGVRHVTKDNYRYFHDQHLRQAIEHLNTPGAVLDRNRLPLNVLFSIADYHCHRDPQHRFTHLVFSSRYQRKNLDTGELSDVVTIEGAHHCEDGAWEVIGARRPAGARDAD